MRKTCQILIPVLLLGLAACSPVQVDAPPLSKPSPPQPPSKPDSCQILRADFNNAALDATAPLAKHKVVRENQRVIRYNCDGAVESDKVETVKSPRLTFDLEQPEKFAYKAVFVFNETSCDHKLTKMPVGQSLWNPYAVYGNGGAKITIWGDIAQALFTFNIDPNLNRIFVRYYQECSPENVAGNEHVALTEAPYCSGEPRSKTVLYPVQIDYTETLLPGSTERKPTPEQCQREKEDREKQKNK